MKKVKVILSGVALFSICALGLTGLNSQVVAQGSGCPNGCMGAGDGCFCHTWHLDFKEYSGGGNSDE